VKKILITGGCGFIGYHLSNSLLKKNNQVVVIDNMNNYYNPRIKYQRHNILKKNKNFFFYKFGIENEGKVQRVFKKHKFDIVINLAAQAGVRFSLKNPKKYLISNILGFFNILEACKKFKIKNLLYASTSSVYGNTKKFPIKENYMENRPVQFYAATKISNEIMATAYSSLYNFKVIGLRFFTVYGPYGRPDMALYKFTDNIFKGKKIEIFNKGNHYRDFTYIDDVINSVVGIVANLSKFKNDDKVNVCKEETVNLMKYVNEIEKNLKKKARITYKGLQKGDVFKTHGSSKYLRKKINYKFKHNYKIGIQKFVKWYLDNEKN
tara:strand:- start:6777 stop:7742 length:966 start_codon:yes stop_codon:yes gene_type:complete